MGYLCKDHLFVLFVILTLIDLVGGAVSWRHKAKLGVAMALLFVPADLYVLYTTMELGDGEMECSYKATEHTAAAVPVTGPMAAIEPGKSPVAHVPTVAVQGKVVDLGSGSASAM